MMACEATAMTGPRAQGREGLPAATWCLRNTTCARQQSAARSRADHGRLYINTPDGRRDGLGIRSIEKLDREEALAFDRRFYAPNSSKLVIAGDKSRRPRCASWPSRVVADPAAAAFAPRRVRPQEPVTAAAATVPPRPTPRRADSAEALLPGAVGGHRLRAAGGTRWRCWARLGSGCNHLI